MPDITAAQERMLARLKSGEGLILLRAKLYWLEPELIKEVSSLQGLWDAGLVDTDRVGDSIPTVYTAAEQE